MTDQIDWKTYYEKLHGVCDFDPATDRTEIHRCLAAWSAFPRKKISSILDVGCGDGYFCHWIAAKSGVGKVIGVDLSQGRLARARSRYPEIEFIQGEISQLPFQDRGFDVVTCIEVLEHQVDPVAAMRELRRVACRYVVVTVPDRQVLREALCPHCLRTYPAGGHLHSFDTARLEELAHGAGLVVERASSYYLPVGARGILPRSVGAVLRKFQLLLRPRKGRFLAARMRRV